MDEFTRWTGDDMRRSIVALLAGTLLLALAVPALAQNGAYPPVPDPTCAVAAEVIELPGIISLQGTGWQPDSQVRVSLLGLVWFVQTDGDGNFDDEIVIDPEQVIDLFDELELGETLSLTLECSGTDQRGDERTVLLTIQVIPSLLNGIGGNGNGGLLDGVLGGSGGDGLLGTGIVLPPAPSLPLGLLSGSAEPAPWDPKTNGATFVILLGMLLVLVGGGDLLVWSRRRNATTLPDGSRLPDGSLR